MTRFCFAAALTMSLGWGLRGFIGGGPLGAMIPGAFIGLLICLLLGRKGSDAALITAFAAIGVGFGGQETYGQTIGLSFQPETQWWGLLGLAIKGAVWGLLAGAFIGMALELPQWTRSDIIVGIFLTMSATHFGWKFLNEPKLIYFSNPIDRPRPELWAGLLLTGVTLLLWLHLRGKGRAPLALAAWGTLGGGIGFGLGGWIQVIGHHAHLPSGVGWWKVMEFTFGFLLGLSLAIPVWQRRRSLTGSPEGASDSGAPNIAWPAFAVALGVALFWANEVVELRWSFMLIGGLLAAAVLQWRALAWHIAITATYCAFAFDLIEHWKALTAVWAWVLVVVTTAIVAWLAWRARSVMEMFLLLVWSSVTVAVVKLLTPGAPKAREDGLILLIVFVLMGIVSTLLSRGEWQSTPRHA
ncbi:MAG: hypothetical protein IT168_09650 [Bryobacterales bacterium]|nr:hypothetical protein [Bryobacterales bacterium]